MIRPLAALVALSATALAQGPEAEPFQATPRFNSTAAAVESAGVRRMLVYPEFFTTEFVIDIQLRYVIAIKRESNNAAFDAQGKPSELFALLMRHTGKSRDELTELLRSQEQRIGELQTFIRKVGLLNEAIDHRAQKKTRDEIYAGLVHAAQLGERKSRLAKETAKFRESRDMYRAYATLKAKANRTEVESGELSKLERLLPGMSVADATEFGDYMERMANLNLATQVRYSYLLFEEVVQAARLRATLVPLTGAKLEADRRDRAELAELTVKLEKLPEEVTLRSLLPDSEVARDAFADEYIALQMKRVGLRFYRADGAKGEFQIRAFAGRGEGNNSSMIEVGAEGAARLAISGTDKIRISSPDVKAFTRLDPDFAATMKAMRNGKLELVPSPPQDDPVIEMPFQKDSKQATLQLFLSDGVEVDLRDLAAKNQMISAVGGGRFLFSDVKDRSMSRLLLFAKPGVKNRTPVVVSLPAAIQLTDREVSLTPNQLLLRLDCLVTALIEETNAPSLDLELRGDGTKTKTIPVLRRGKSQFADTKALLAGIDVAKKELASEK